MSQPTNKPAKTKSPVLRVVFRSYSKAIFLYPLFFFSLVAWMIQSILDNMSSAPPGTGTNPILSIIWIVLFFTNLFIVAFDYPVGKFVLLVLLIAVGILVGVLVLMFVDLPDFGSSGVSSLEFLDIKLTGKFYSVISGILGFILLGVLFEAQFHHVRIEKNEVIVKGFDGFADRYPVQNLRYTMKYSDIFERLLLRAASIDFRLGDQIIPLHTVPFAANKGKDLDDLLSSMKVHIQGA